MIIHGDCEEELQFVKDNTLDCCVTDPPYGISFMNKHWDYQIPSVALWEEILRVLKPGAYLLCACGTRTQHRMAVNIEDAGFEIRDVITWHYGSGFPKSMELGKQMDKAVGEKGTYNFTPEEMTTVKRGEKLAQGSYVRKDRATSNPVIYSGSSNNAKTWNGWGTALKPATEFWTLARKPLSEKTVVENVLKWGTGGINIDGCRIESGEEYQNTARVNDHKFGGVSSFISEKQKPGFVPKEGRFPANLILDELAGQMLDEQSGVLKSGELKGYNIPGESDKGHLKGKNSRIIKQSTKSEGGASRFFYCAKASAAERTDANTHPTVKPLKLMRYLVKLVCPPGGTVLEPFAGSGTTCVACMEEGFKFLAYEKNADYYKIANERIEI